MVSGAQSSSLSTGWWLILWIQRTINLWVHPPGRSFADKGGGKEDLSDNLNAAQPSSWKSGQDSLTLSSVSEMYSTAVICLPWERDFFWVARRFWLPCHISKKLWTLAILFNFLSSACFFISELFSVLILSSNGSAPAKIPLLAWANCLTTTFSRRVSPVVFDYPQPISSRPREQLASTPTQSGMIETMSRAALERSAYLECVSSGWHHQLVMSGNQNVLLISIGSEWEYLRFGLIRHQFFGVSGYKVKEILAAVNKRAAWSLRPGVVSATFLGVMYSSSSQHKSYASMDHWQDPKTVSDRIELLLGKVLCLFTGTRRCMAQYSFSTYFRKASWYWVV